MKTKSILLCILFAIAANLFTTAKAQVNTTDSLALVDLYNSTNGPHWTTHTNWLTKKPVSTWYGITVTNNRVTEIYLRTNNLSGVLPSSIGNLANLIYLILYDNQLSGAIPTSVGSLTNLGTLGLATNKLSGTIPPSIGNLENLSNLSLGVNQLSGAIPPEIGNLKNLSDLYLSDNQLSGVIPPEIGNLTNLFYLNLDLNQLSGAIPAEIGKLINVSRLDLNQNQLTGAIPAEIGNMAKLVVLYLSNNQLSGAIPSEIGNLANASDLFLYLNNNNLSGSIPASFHKLYIQLIDISHNKLSQDKNIKFSTYKHTNEDQYINNNLFTFNGLEHLATDFPNAVYAPQDTMLPIHQTGNTLSVSAGGTLGNNTYFWHKVGDTSKTIIKKDSTFSPAQSGMYYVTVTNKVVEKLTLYSDTISYTMPLAETQNSVANSAAVKAFNSKFSIYPNPAKDVIHVQINGSTDIVLTNSAGKIIFSKSINNDSEINVSSYANGIYYIQNKTTGETQKLIVSH